MSKQTYRVCCCFSRRFRIKEAEIPEEIKEIFRKYSDDHGVMNVEHFFAFLKEFQREEKIVTVEEAQNLMVSVFNQHKHTKIFHHKSMLMHLEHFFRFLLNDVNAPLISPNEVCHDMNAPLSHYFIFTGHNSYLTGNQISSDCSEVPIIEALKKGVRVIELDMWPNPTKDNVDILHGGTLTTPVELIRCLRAIEKYAFVASEYPVILTLEDHLTPDLQAKVAKMVTEVFGDTLFISNTSDSMQDLPSPESLKKRVIISTKPPKKYLENNSSKKEINGTLKVEKSSSEAAWGNEIPEFIDKVNHTHEESDIQDEDDHHDENQNLLNEYKHLIAIRNEKMKGGIKAWLKVNLQKVHRVSLNEEKLEKAVMTHGTDIVRFNQRNLMRVYPKATRIYSSNYNPFIGWIHGAQMVAFNMQTHGRSLWLMQGMFKANGGCGYVKKPDLLLNVGPDGNGVFDPRKHSTVKKTLKVKVYMGEGWNLDFHRTHFDLYSPPDFYVKLGIAGVPADTQMKKTKAIEDNWIPSWNEEFEFPLTVPELALLRIEVHEFDMSGKDDFGGQTCLPVAELKSGIRAVPLHDQKGDMYKSVKLLLRFEFV